MQQTTVAPAFEGPTGEVAAIVSFKTSQGIEAQATVLRLAPHSVAFESYSPQNILRLSEVLTDFTVKGDTRWFYSGNATISGLVNAGAVTVCEATLDSSLLDVDLSHLGGPQKALSSFNSFLNHWGKFYRILPEYKLAVTDLQSFLHELRLWLDQIELGIRSLPAGDRLETERGLVQELIEPVAPAITAMFERFELAARAVPPELAPAHFTFCRRQLHPLLLASPFMYRIFTKPLGYAGDYEMVSMILRDPCEGSSLFAKLLNVFILRQAPAEAHRNRAAYLVEKLIEETNRRFQRGSPCRVFNIACGPAGEVQDFLIHHPLSHHAQFTLLDANEETLQYTGRVLQELKTRHSRGAQIKLVKKSVQQLLKQSGKPRAQGEEYDFVYSAGLFDYLNDRVCKMLINLGYELLAPGGLLLVTNVDPINPICNIMAHIYEWHLVYRNGDQLAALASGLPPEASVSVKAELTGSNIFLEVRKPPLQP